MVTSPLMWFPEACLTSYRANGFLVYVIIWRASHHHNRALPSPSALVCSIQLHSCAISNYASI